MFSTFGAPIRETFANPINNSNNLVKVKSETGIFEYGRNSYILYENSVKVKNNIDSEYVDCKDCQVIDNSTIKVPKEEKFPKEEKVPKEENDSEEVAFSESESDSSDESDSDPEEEESKNEEGNYFSSSSNTTTKTTSVKNNEEETDSEESEEPESTSVVDENDEDKDESEEEGNTDGEDEDEDEDESNVPVPTTGEGFYGGSNVEHFSNKNGFTMSSVFSINLLLKSVMIACLFYVLAHPDTKKYILGRVFKNIKPENYLYVAMLLFLVIFYVIGIFL
jgi:hypothetical protein